MRILCPAVSATEGRVCEVQLDGAVLHPEEESAGRVALQSATRIDPANISCYGAVLTLQWQRGAGGPGRPLQPQLPTLAMGFPPWLLYNVYWPGQSARARRVQEAAAGAALHCSVSHVTILLPVQLQGRWSQYRPVSVSQRLYIYVYPLTCESSYL